MKEGSGASKEPVGIGELSSVSMLGRPELLDRRSTVEKVIALEELGTQAVEAEIEVAGMIAAAAAIEVLSVKQVEEEEEKDEEAVAPNMAF